jgi:hypothetical protein
VVSFTTFLVVAAGVVALGLVLRRLWPRLLSDPRQAQYGQAMGMSVASICFGAWLVVYGVQHGQGGRIVAGTVAIAVFVGVFLSAALALRWYRRTGTVRRLSRLLVPEYPLRQRTDVDSFLVEVGFRDAKPVGVLYDRETRRIGEAIDLDDAMPEGGWPNVALNYDYDEWTIAHEAAKLFYDSGGKGMTA